MELSYICKYEILQKEIPEPEFLVPYTYCKMSSLLCFMKFIQVLDSPPLKKGKVSQDYLRPANNFS